MSDKDRILAFITRHGASDISSICMGTSSQTSSDATHIKRKVTEMAKDGALSYYTHGRNYVYYINASRKWLRCKW